MSRSPESFSDHFRKAVKVSNGYANHETTRFRSEQRPWGVYDTSLREYEKDFHHVFSGTFAEFLHKRKEEKGKAIALDVMGTARFSEVYPVDGEAAITLVDFRDDKQKQTDDENNRLVIDGNVLLTQTWRKAQAFLKENATEGFDLITNRPAAGWTTMRRSEQNHYERIQWHMIDRMYTLLAPDGGQLLTQLPFGTTAERWEALNVVHGIHVQTKGYFMGITKNSEAPKRLPR